MEAPGPAPTEAATASAPTRGRKKQNVATAGQRKAGRGRDTGEVRPDGGGQAAPDREAQPAAREKRATAKDVGTKKRKSMDTQEALEVEGADPQRMKMTDLIRRAEAQERLKAKDNPTTKAAPKKRAARVRNAQPQPQPVENVPLAVPQVQVVDGRIVLNEESLVISSHGTDGQNWEGYTRVEEIGSTLNYHSYSKRKPVSRWKPEETARFYRALEQFGTDFGIIERLFPSRTRRQVKAKYKTEERLNPRRLDDAVSRASRGPVYHRDLVEMLTAPAADEVEAVVDGNEGTMSQDAAGEVAAAPHREPEMGRCGEPEILHPEGPDGEGQVENHQDELEAAAPENRFPSVSASPEPEDGVLDPPDSPEIPMFSY